MVRARVALLALLLAATGAAPLRAEPELTSYETAHYTLLTDLDPAEVPEVTAWLEAMHTTYRRVFKGEPIQKLHKARVRIYRQERDFLAHDPAMTDTRGYYEYEAHQLVSYRGESITDLCSLLSHEGVHQFLNEYANKDGEGFPGWFEEGLAEYFCTSRRTRDGKRLQRVRSDVYVRLIRDALKQGALWSLGKLWAYDAEQLPAEEAETFYAHGSLLVEFLVREQPKLIQELYRQKRAGGSNADIMARVFGTDPARHKQLEARWRAWLEHLPEPAEEGE